MIGLDATTLIAYEIKEHPLHGTVRGGIRHCLADGQTFGLCDQTIWEFLHIVTDARRFSHPLSMDDAVKRAARWSQAREVRNLPPTEESRDWTLKWMREFKLGRKRILDTALAAVLHVNGVSRIATANRSDFECFGVFSFEPWALVHK
ncbi:MAG: hypothetical protein JJU29_20030 [Verrucomicrobia bacterium]|nr:hypothetical protein [Verrucomicrobiota bacterium]MCH8514243.1 hypothetical protein [Kiritimatiellia bacterium]